MTDPPTNIRALQADQILEVTWPGERIDRIPYRLLRAECPCASCRDEWTGQRTLDPASIRPDLKLTGMENIGTYAIQLTFSDGHATGIYSWDLLYDYGLHQEQMWQLYLKRLEEAGVSREPGPAPFEQRPKSK